jgi:hypothetical protein
MGAERRNDSQKQNVHSNPDVSVSRRAVMLEGIFRHSLHHHHYTARFASPGFL